MDNFVHLTRHKILYFNRSQYMEMGNGIHAELPAERQKSGYKQLKNTTPEHELPSLGFINPQAERGIHDGKMGLVGMRPKFGSHWSWVLRG
ncbi:hypothetical protein MJO28_010751 [Puccinia striiformis f. sp. tritici]|uniref:Uncharacterized protein n=3 Tax=Puccinia striiformis TaxID=27350 RepID=A0ACC0E5X9_9BASI|nr:hypothetical protein MJO28_010750 [Puccinia striiformis f. sp. tritici]KAI7945056.1 hypothetical protein MJO28_010751 [Puccinia striiformis f. sp. tritici]